MSLHKILEKHGYQITDQTDLVKLDRELKSSYFAKIRVGEDVAKCYNCQNIYYENGYGGTVTCYSCNSSMCESCSYDGSRCENYIYPHSKCDEFICSSCKDESYCNSCDKSYCTNCWNSKSGSLCKEICDRCQKKICCGQLNVEEYPGYCAVCYDPAYCIPCSEEMKFSKCKKCNGSICNQCNDNDKFYKCSVPNCDFDKICDDCYSRSEVFYKVSIQKCKLSLSDSCVKLQETPQETEKKFEDLYCDKHSKIMKQYPDSCYQCCNQIVNMKNKEIEQINQKYKTLVDLE